MNIGLFTETYYPEINGVATSVYMLKNELERLGHNVYVFTTTTPGAPEFERNVFRVHSLPCVFITERRVGLFYQHKLASVIKRLNLDVIHTNTEFSLGIFGRIMAKELHIPLVHTYHTIYEDYTHYVTHNHNKIDDRAKAFMRVFSKVCCNTVEQVIAPTEKTKELLEKYSVTKEINVIPTGIDLHKFAPELYKREEILELRKQYGIRPEEKVLIYLGRVSAEKNIGELLKAMPRFMSEHADAKFLLVGSGPDMGPLQAMVKEYGLEERVIFAGAQPWDIIGKFYQMGDVFVSASNSETQGLTYFEAMAAGLPVVAREDKCLEEILEQGKNGYTFTTQDELIYGLNQVLYEKKDVDFRTESMKKVEKYSSEQFARNVLCVYKNILELERISEQRRERDEKRISLVRTLGSNLMP